ncbi:hypothetical protein JTE90_003086 [Oedothorax gibbosus]|uniref:Endoplasmic reticulum transmembrane protein n=1 Tax=Oedothorax gibbosus TaxID=931172 RepID=A0AAV6TW41_9ARAC|nr:hypothetical protein JTE90_003086 [Oedothorax gibbosus]
MTIQWSLIASFLYLELGAIILLSLPFISSKIWRSIFQFRLWVALGRKANTYFSVFLAVLILFWIDSIREMIKYSNDPRHQFDIELQTHVKLYRSQRNYYIVGFAIFLCFVIRKLAMLLLEEAELLTRNEEVTKSAQEATENLEKLLREDKVLPVSKQVPNEHLVKETESMQRQIDEKNDELNSIKENIESIKNRNQETIKEYDSLKAKVDSLKSSLSMSS